VREAFLAPGVYAQAAMREALQAAGLEGSQLAGLQMHGTGTALGDPIVSAVVAVQASMRPCKCMVILSACAACSPAPHALVVVRTRPRAYRELTRGLPEQNGNAS